MLTFPTIVLSVAILLVAGPSHSNNGSNDKAAGIASDTVVMHHGAGLEPAARHIRELYPALLKETQDSLGVRMPEGKVNMVIVKDDQFMELSSNSSIMAYAMPSRKSIVLNYDALHADELVLRATLKHEIAHLLIHSATNGDMPKWLDEGISQWASGGHSEIRQTGDSWPLSKAALTHRLIPMSSLVHTFPADEEGMRLSYMESLSVVDLMVSDYGPGIIGRMLRDAREGSRIENSFHTHTGLSFAEFASKWEDNLLSRSHFIIFMRSHLYELMFFLAGVALTVGFIRTYYRIRTYRDPEDEVMPPESEDRE